MLLLPKLSLKPFCKSGAPILHKKNSPQCEGCFFVAIFRYSAVTVTFPSEQATVVTALDLFQLTLAEAISFHCCVVPSKVTVVKVQFSNTLEASFVNVSGMTIVSSFEQPAKDLYPSSVTAEGRLTSVKFVHP